MHIAIVGSGQLAQMMAMAGKELGHTFSFIAGEHEEINCVESLGSVVRLLPELSFEALYEALGRPAVVTAEKEQLNIELLKGLQAHCPVHPNVQSFAACQDRHAEKQLLSRLGIDSADYVYGKNVEQITAKLPLPVVAKSCREGYDGKNQWVIKTDQDMANFASQAEGDDYIVEQWIPFDKEVSQVSVRSQNGGISHYPLTENRHEKGILRESIAPAMNVPAAIQAAAQDYITRIMTELDYVGVLAVECFVVQDRLLVNELAPRVHNSGHWTQAGDVASQFENHIRAISGMDLGQTEIDGVAGMVNLIGIEKPSSEAVPAQADLHWYGKSVRAGRKLGHINLMGDNHQDLLAQMEQLQTELYAD